MNKSNCENCRFGRTGMMGGFVECRRHAPQVKPEQNNYTYSFPCHQFPSMSFNDWCGDWQARLNESGTT